MGYLRGCSTMEHVELSSVSGIQGALCLLLFLLLLGLFCLQSSPRLGSLFSQEPMLWWSQWRSSWTSHLFLINSVLFHLLSHWQPAFLCNWWGNHTLRAYRNHVRARDSVFPFWIYHPHPAFIKPALRVGALFHANELKLRVFWQQWWLLLIWGTGYS